MPLFKDGMKARNARVGRRGRPARFMLAFQPGAARPGFSRAARGRQSRKARAWSVSRMSA